MKPALKLWAYQMAYSIGSSQHDILVIEGQQESERVCKQRECNYRSDIWHLLCILLVGSQSQLPPTLRGEGSHKSMDSRREDHRASWESVCHKDSDNIGIYGSL